MEFSGRGFKSYSGQLSTDLDLELKRVYPKNYENKRLQLNQKHQKFQQNLDKHCLKKWNNIKQKEILSIDFNTTEKFDIEKKEVQEHSKFICKNLQNVTDNRHYRKKQSKLYTDVVKSTDSSVEEAPESGKTINQSTFTEIIQNKETIIVGCIYRHPSIDMSDFNKYNLSSLIETLFRKQKNVLLGDFNVDLLKYDSKT